MSVLSWNTPTTISNLNAYDPRVVIDLNGNSTSIWIEKSTYNVGTASQSGTTVTGSGTTFTSSMVGGTLTYANGITVNITAFNSATSLTTTQSLTVANQGYTIYYNGVVIAKTLPNGGSWSTATQLSTTGNNSISPRIGVDSNAIVSVVWAENTIINYASYNGTWSGVTALSTGTGASNPTMAVDTNGNVVVAWTKSGNTEAIVKPISTGIWSSVTTFTTTNSDNPSIAIGGTVTTVVWHARPTGSDQIMAARATTIGGAFSSPVNIVGVANAGNNHNYPKVAVDTNGNSLATWYRSNFGGSMNTDYINVAVLATTLIASGTSWNIPVMISSLGERNPANLTIKVSYDLSGNAYIVWTSSTTGETFNIESNIRQISGSLSGAAQVVSANITANYTSISISSLSDVLLVFTFYDGTNCVINAVETDIGGFPLNIYTPQVTISTPSTNNSNPRASISLIGSTVDAISVWESYDSGNSAVIIQAATGSKPVLGPPTGLSVTQNVVNLGVFNEFENVLNWTASTDPNVIGYNIYRNNIFIGQVDFTTISFTDHNAPQSGTGVTITYSVSSLDINYQQSPRVNVNIS